MSKNGVIFMLLVLCMPALLFAQTGEIKGKITDNETGEALAGANVSVVGTSLGAASNSSGEFTISSVPPGVYTVKASFIGFTSRSSKIRVVTNEAANLNFNLDSETIAASEVIISVNRARERETPVAFSDISAEEINRDIHGQDAPLLLKGKPGVYAFSTDGVGNGEAQLFVRGFNQDYVQVSINGVPTNDPESNRVYWSNWGSVSAAASNIQVQRGAGSSLYGAGSFGGSFNIITQDARPEKYYGFASSLGDPQNTMYGVKANTGLINDKFAVSFALDRKLGTGSREGGIYKGVNYYLSSSWYLNNQHTLKMVLHGAPQEHSYSWSDGVEFFETFGYDANPSPFITRAAAERLPASASGKANFGLLDGRREVLNGDVVALAHNHFHKPQLEFHYSYDISEKSALRSTFFYSLGRGGGSSLNDQGGFGLGATRNDRGIIDDPDYIATSYLRNAGPGRQAYQRDSFSLHRQLGLISSYDTQVSDKVKLTLGGEARSWFADHPGFFTNLYGSEFITDRSYAYRVPGGGFSTFRRKNIEGDIGHASDTGSPFGWDLDAAVAANPTMSHMYRNYEGRTPQFTLFGSTNLKLTDKLNAIGTLQYVWYEYQITENLPGANAIGDPVPAGTVSSEGPDGSGNFYMEDAENPGDFYRFELVDETRSRGFFQPKFGLNYNLNDNLNVFGSFAHVERFVDLSIFYNDGLIDPSADDEKSDQFEVGMGWQSPNFFAKVNAYNMTWDNKSTTITDPSKAGEPGFDRNGNKTQLIGKSTHQGIEFEASAKLFPVIGIRGLNLTGSLTLMDNTWTDVLDEVRLVAESSRTGLQEDTNLNGSLDAGEDTNNNGALDEDRSVFLSAGSNVLDSDGNRNAVYFDELVDTHVANQPQSAVAVGLTYDNRSFFAQADLIYFTRDYTADGQAFRAVAGEFDASGDFVVTKFSDQTPSRATIDLAAGYRFDIGQTKVNITGQVINLLDKEYFASADNFGFLPGALRTFRVNLNVGY